jgi:alpha-tubulin suppressor-like RCC1 family protein
MPGQFLSPDGDLESAFVSDPAIIDQFAKTGSLWVWGGNIYGHLGTNQQDENNGGIAGTSTPVQTVAGSTNWKQIARGYNSQAAIKTDGTLWAWGYNFYGSLGDGTGGNSTNKSSPVQTVAGGTNWKQVSVGFQYGHAIKTDGTLWAWGSNADGGLGDGTTTNRSSPVQISGNIWKQVSSGRSITTAIKTDGTLWGWGHNYYGQIGDGTTTYRSSPVQITGGGTTWKLVSTCWYHTAAIKTDGTLWSWGYGGQGAMGDNTTNDKSSPVQTVSAGTNWKQVAAGSGFTTAIKTDGTLWTWGANDYATLGDGTTVNKSSPIQTTAGGTNWKQISSNYFASGAIKTDGTLWTWGANYYGGMLGDGTVDARNSLAQTSAGGTNWKQISVGYYGMAAIYFYDAGNLYP